MLGGSGCVRSPRAQRATIISGAFKQVLSRTVKEPVPVRRSCPNTAAEPSRPEEPSRRPETLGELFLKSRLAPDRCSRVTCVMQRPSFPNNGGCVGRRVWREAGTGGEGEERGSERSSRQLPPPHPTPTHPGIGLLPAQLSATGLSVEEQRVEAPFTAPFLPNFPSFLSIRLHSEWSRSCCVSLCVYGHDAGKHPPAGRRHWAIEQKKKKVIEREKERKASFRRSVCNLSDGFISESAKAR